MMTERKNTQLKMYTLTVEDLVPQEHFLRKVDRLIDFSFIYDEVRELYSAVGRPSVDPVILIKTLLIGYLYGINSERQLEMEIQVNLAYRWFLSLDLDAKVPDHSTMSQNRRRRFNGTGLFRNLFERILAECIGKGLVDGDLIMTDSTHVKANASKKSEIRVNVEKEAASYMARLDRHEAEERALLESEGRIKPKSDGKLPDGPTPKSKAVERTASKTDPDAGLLGRPGKPLGMHYLSHQSLDSKSGIIVDVEVTAGNTPDCNPYLDRIEYIREKIGIGIRAVAVDSGYDNSLIHKELDEWGIQIFTPRKKTSDTSKAEFGRRDFLYNEADDTFTCPNAAVLSLKGLQRNESLIAREYRANAKGCKECPHREKCLAPSQRCRKIQVNIFEGIVNKHHARDNSEEYHEALKRRSSWCEGTFGNQVSKHNLRSLMRRGLEAASDHCLLSATAMNIKRMVMRIA